MFDPNTRLYCHFIAGEAPVLFQQFISGYASGRLISAGQEAENTANADDALDAAVFDHRYVAEAAILHQALHPGKGRFGDASGHLAGGDIADRHLGRLGAETAEGADDIALRQDAAKLAVVIDNDDDTDPFGGHQTRRLRCENIGFY
jgi:hypothetical protein